MTPEQQVDTVVERLRRKGYNVDRSKEIQPIQRTFQPNGVLLHHTASTDTISRAAELSDIGYMNRDQPGWPAPHTQFFVGRTATIYVLAAGCAYHAGVGSGLVKYGIPKDLGNQYLWGIEAQDDGYGRDWPDEQWLAVAALAGELLTSMDKPVTRVWRHLDYSDAGKVDTRYPLDKHREAVRQYLNNEQEEPMQKEDFDKIEQIVNRAIDKKVPDIAQAVMGADLTAKDPDDGKSTVRRALRKVLGL